MTDSTLHVVFNTSAAADLRDALRQAGRDERVVSLFDCLSFGPIDPPDGGLREKWVEEKLGASGWEEVTLQAESFWSQARSAGHRKIAWMSRRSAQEYAGFLEWLWQIGEEPVEVVDLTDVMVTAIGGERSKRRLAICFGMLPPQTILENALFDRAEPLAPAARDRYREQWKRLKNDNAPLRVLREGDLVFAPITFFDPLVMSCATREWQKSARVVGAALSDFLETSVLQVGDIVLWARARALASAGHLEFRGDLSDIRGSELRLPDRLAP